MVVTLIKHIVPKCEIEFIHYLFIYCFSIYFNYNIKYSYMNIHIKNFSCIQDNSMLFCRARKTMNIENWTIIPTKILGGSNGFPFGYNDNVVEVNIIISNATIVNTTFVTLRESTRRQTHPWVVALGTTSSNSFKEPKLAKSFSWTFSFKCFHTYKF